MNRPAFTLFACLFFSLPFLVADDQLSLESVPPVVVKTLPVAGTSNIKPSLAKIEVTFSKQMTDGTWSWSTVTKDSFPEIVGKPKYSKDGRTCTVNVKLKPNTTYGLWLNSGKHKNFKDKEGTPAIPYLLVFKTSQ